MYKKGFTLIELLVVISIVSLMSSIVIASVSTAREKGRVAGAKKFSGYTYRAFGADAQLILNFDVTSSPFTTDESGNNYPVTIPALYTPPIGTNPKNPSGVGRSLQLAVGQALEVVPPVGSELSTATDDGKSFTYSAWYYQIAALPGSGDGYIFSRGGGPSSNLMSGIMHNKTTNQFCGVQQYGNPSPTGNYTLCGGPVIKYSQWYNVALSIDGVKRVATLYVDGQQIGSDVSLSNTLTNYSTYDDRYRIGGRTSNHLTGLVDEVRLYTQALTSAQAQQLYAQGIARHLTVNR